MAKLSCRIFIKFLPLQIMLCKTRGIVLHRTPYSDFCSIVRIYTEEFGPMSYLTASSKGKKSRVPKSLFHPLSVLELEVEHQNLREIQRIKEARNHLSLIDLSANPVKVSISIFLAEFLGRILKEASPNKLLFDFILQSLKILDLSEKSCANFHLVFMIGLSRFLGFYPNIDGFRKGMFFDLKNGEFALYKPLHPHSLNPDESLVFLLLLRMNYENMGIFRFSGRDRYLIIERILEYYRIHLTDFPEIKSLDILHEVFG